MVSIYSELLRLADEVNEIEEEHIPGGLGDLTDLGGVNPEQLAKGIIVEYKEHTDDPLTALEIALDHLTEVEGEPYYDFLNDMEGDMKEDEGEESLEEHEESESEDEEELEHLEEGLGEEAQDLEEAEDECEEAEMESAEHEASEAEEECDEDSDLEAAEHVAAEAETQLQSALKRTRGAAGEGLRDRVKNFFMKNPEVNDDEVHAFANSIGMDKSDIENEIYKYLSEMLGVPEQAPSEDDLGAPEDEASEGDDDLGTPEGDLPADPEEGDLPADPEEGEGDDVSFEGDEDSVLPEVGVPEDLTEEEPAEDDEIDFSEDDELDQPSEQEGKRVVNK